MSPKELDLRIQTLPPAHGVHHFKNGISALSQISGLERKHMACILLGCLVGKIPRQGYLCIKALLDFMYLAQYKTHDKFMIGYMTDALDIFNQNKDYFIQPGLRDDLNIPKFHSLMHYVNSIQLFGTTDNYNTEMFEWLHIDFAKKGWHTSNRRDEFPQMITWLSRQEKISSFDNYLEWIEQQSNPTQPPLPTSTRLPILMAKHCPYPGCHLTHVEKLHCAPSFSKDLKEYLNRFLEHGLRSTNQVAVSNPLPFQCLDVFTQFRFHPASLHNEDNECDTVKASPITKKMPAGRFDTVVALRMDHAEATGLQGIVIQILLPYWIATQDIYICRHPHWMSTGYIQAPCSSKWYPVPSKLASGSFGICGMVFAIAANCS